MSAVLTSVDHTTLDLLLTCTVQINCPSHYPKSVYTLCRRISEFETLYKYLNNTFGHILIRPPPFHSLDMNFLKNSTSKFLDVIINNDTLQFVPPQSPSLPRKSKSFFSFTEKVQDVDTFYEECWDKISHLLEALECIGQANSKIGKSGATLTEISKKIFSDAPVKELKEISKLKVLLIALEIQESKDLEYRNTILNDELIYIVRWLNGLRKSLSYRHYLLCRYETACKKTSQKLSKLEKLKTSSSIGSSLVDSVLQEFTVIKQEEGIARSDFRNISESLKPQLVEFLNEIELELIGIWARWADFNRNLSKQLLVKKDKF